jgi:hypothetical protein
VERIQQQDPGHSASQISKGEHTEVEAAARCNHEPNTISSSRLQIRREGRPSLPCAALPNEKWGLWWVHRVSKAKGAVIWAEMAPLIAFLEMRDRMAHAQCVGSVLEMRGGRGCARDYGFPISFHFTLDHTPSRARGGAAHAHRGACLRQI